MRKREYVKTSETMDAIMRYLTEIRPLKDDGEYIPYGELAAGIKEKIGLDRSRHAIAYAIERLRKLGKIAVYDNKLHLVVGA